MAYRLNRMLLISMCSDVAKSGRNTWNSFRSCCTCLQRPNDQPKQQFTLNSRNCLVKPRDVKQTARRNHQTLPSDFNAHLPSLKQMEHFLSSRKVLFQHGHTSLIASCPFCASKEEETDKAKIFTLYINKTTGSHFCNNCGSSGSWRQFKMAFHEGPSKESIKPHSIDSHSKRNDDLSSQIWEKSTALTQCNDDVWEKLIKQFSIKELRRDMLEKFQVRFTEHEFKDPNGKTKKHDCILFPWYDAAKPVVKGVKLVKLQESDSSDSSIAIEPRQGFLGLFGWNTVDAEAKEVVLTLTEFDAIAVSQSTSYPAISLPLGANSLPIEVLPQLEQFEKIILWFGNDVVSRHAANQFAKKLNLQRCFLVRPDGDNTPANALDALNMGCDLPSLVSKAQPISHEKITTFHQLRGEVFDQFVNADQVAGVKWTRFPKLNNILKGLRRGEVTVFTGPTGAGKTTLLSEMSLDLCMQGVNTLWGSFEIRNVRLVKMMMCQYSGLNLEKQVEQFQYWADSFEMLPMYFMCFYGAQNIETVIETMTHAAYVYDIEHVIVDNLQFMTSYVSRGDDRFFTQNHVISALRNFASTKNVHVTLVIHPRKENDDVELQTASIFGTAKASQEADNVIILQSKKGSAEKYLQVTKNRFDGVLGRVPLDFVRESLSMSGFGKTAQPKKPTLKLDKAHPQKLKITRLGAGVDISKFSAPKLLRTNKVVDRKSIPPQPASNDYSDGTKDDPKYSNKEETGLNSAPEKRVSAPDVISAEKKENVQKTVKKILSGTRLFTKAVNGPRNSKGASEQDKVIRKPQNHEI